MIEHTVAKRYAYDRRPAGKCADTLNPLTDKKFLDDLQDAVNGGDTLRAMYLLGTQLKLSKYVKLSNLLGQVARLKGSMDSSSPFWQYADGELGDIVSIFKRKLTYPDTAKMKISHPQLHYWLVL